MTAHVPQVELRTLVSEVAVDGDPIVRITREPDGRARPWRVTGSPPEGLGVPADRELCGLFASEQLAIRAAQALAGRLHAARELLRQANEQIRLARTGLRDAEYSAANGEEVSADA